MKKRKNYDILEIFQIIDLFVKKLFLFQKYIILWFQQDKYRAKHYFSDYDKYFQKSKTSNWIKFLKD